MTDEAAVALQRAAPLSTLIAEMSVYQLPYIFRDYDHVFNALDGTDTIVKYYDGVLDKKETFTLADKKGRYVFGALRPGTWDVRVVRPKGLSQTGPKGGKYALTFAGAQVITGKNFGFRKLK